MPKIMRLPALLALVCATSVAIAHLGCSGGGGADGAWIVCAQDEFRLVGQLDGQTIDLRESTVNSGGGMTQFGTGDFSTQMIAPVEDPTRTKLDLQWAKTIADGETTDASGTLRMPDSGPLASQSYCLGTGTQIHFSSDGVNLQFKLTGITGGTGCAASVAGELQGCWR
jgi:hypothetical protein